MESIYKEIRQTTLDICKLLSHEINLVVVPIEIFIFLVFLVNEEAKKNLESRRFQLSSLIDEFAKELDYDSPSQLSTVWEVEKFRMLQYSSIPDQEEGRDQMIALIFVSILLDALSSRKFNLKNDSVGVGMGDGRSTQDLDIAFEVYSKEIIPLQAKMISSIQKELASIEFGDRE